MCFLSCLLMLRPLIKTSLLQIRKRSLYIIGVPLTRCGNSSLLPFLNASSFSSSDEILAIKRGGFTSLLGFSILLFLWEDFSFPPIWKEKFAR